MNEHPSDSSAAPTPQQLETLRRSDLAARKILRAARFARGDGWVLAIGAVITLLTGFTDPILLFVAAALGYIAWQEFAGAAKVARFEPDAADALAMNQLILAAVITIYCLWEIHVVRTTPSAISQDLSPADMAALGDLGDISALEKSLELWAYAAVTVATWIAQGSIAYYYRTRRTHIERYRSETASWVIELQRKSPR